ncbi:hypothetical protein MBCUT_15440 [Methanobrevibacter cuticularis]|uniref:Class III signal peptide n=1 Tax=Methanobrevibacter cuticularis TaxID=47311 RepID=A0A166DBI4_9EURY|nr:hypothetical protein [Methanobrevibacter cuticularis]KZX15411.1 hypothetical protein MBCUT_15440 [Methanobrevibacter cuticularis]
MKFKELIEKKYIKLLIFLIILKHFKCFVIINNSIRRFKKSFKSNLSYFNEVEIFNNKKGQLSLEFLLISLIAILIFISFSLPLENLAIDLTLDSTNSFLIKSEIAKITTAIDAIYSNGPGSKRVIVVDVPYDTRINFHKNIDGGMAESEVTIDRDENKIIELPFKANNSEGSLYLIKGYNKIIIQWIYGEEDIKFNLS